MQRSNFRRTRGSSSIFQMHLVRTKVSRRLLSITGFGSHVPVGFSLITAEDRLTIMNVPERTPIVFFLPHSNTSGYTAIVSVDITLRRILTHILCLESKHQSGVCYRNRTKPDEDTEIIANRSDLAPGCCQRPGFFQGHEVLNGWLSCLLDNSLNLKAFHAVLYFNNSKSARSHTFCQARSRAGFVRSAPDLAMHSSFF